MRTPADLRAWATTKYRAGHRRWLAANDLGVGLELTYPLQPPTEAVAAANPGAAASWAAGWRTASLVGVDLVWRQVRWTSLGAQRLPEKALVHGASAAAGLAGTASDWRRLSATVGRMRAHWPDAALDVAVQGTVAALRQLSTDDVEGLIAVVDWFVAHPGSGMYGRQVPVEGVDTKWLERHSSLVQRLVAAHTGTTDLGLRTESRRFRVRVLDAGITGELLDFTAPVSELSRLDWQAGCILISENLQTLAALGELPGVVAIHGNGFVVTELAGLPWLAGLPVLYWGDLDSHGFAILGSLRAVLPQTESVLMDTATVERFKHLAVIEPAPRRGPIGHLTASEARALEALRTADLRLEQERIPWGHASDAIESAVARASGLQAPITR